MKNALKSDCDVSRRSNKSEEPIRAQIDYSLPLLNKVITILPTATQRQVSKDSMVNKISTIKD